MSINPAYQLSIRDDTTLRVAEGAGLPEVTSDDNGKVLTVVEGEWGAAQPAGGDPDFRVEITFADSQYSINKTFAEIDAAVQNGQRINAVMMTNKWDVVTVAPTSNGTTTTQYSFYCVSFDLLGNRMSVLALTLNTSDVLSRAVYNYTLTAAS